MLHFGYSLSARGEDPDGVLESVSYYSNGQLISTIDRIQGIPETSQSYPLLFDVNSTLSSTEERGVRSLFAIVDNSGNYVASEVHNISFTTGAGERPEINISSGLMGFPVDASDVNISISPSGEITDIELIGELPQDGFLAAKLLISSSGNGVGAEFEPIIQTDPQQLDYGKITGFDQISGGSGYDDGNVTLKIVPVIRSVNEGQTAQLEYVLLPPTEANATSRPVVITSAANPDGSLQTW